MDLTPHFVGLNQHKDASNMVFLKIIYIIKSVSITYM